MIETSLQEFLCGFHVAMRRDRRHGRDFILAPAHGRGRANVGLVHVDTSAARWWYTYPFEKYEFVSWDYDIPNIWSHKKCSKPATRYYNSPPSVILETDIQSSSTIINYHAMFIEIYAIYCNFMGMKWIASMNRAFETNTTVLKISWKHDRRAVKWAPLVVAG